MTLPITSVQQIAAGVMMNNARPQSVVWGLSTADNEYLAKLAFLGPHVSPIVTAALANSTTKPWTNFGYNYTGTPAPNPDQSGINTEAARRSSSIQTTVTALLAAHSPTAGVGGGPNDMSITGNLVLWLSNNVP